MTELTSPKSPLGTAAQAEFCQVLLEHLRAGLPVAEGLASLARGARSQGLRRVAEFLRASVVDRGLLLSDAMASSHRAFSEAFVSLVRSSEETGTLADVLDCLLREASRQRRLRATVHGMVLYPVFVIWASVAVVVAAEVFVVPHMIRIHSELGSEIPTLTQWVFDLSNDLIYRWWLFVLPAGAFLAWQIPFLLRRDFGGYTWHVLRFVPPFKTHFGRLNSAAFLGMAGGLLRCGVALPDALGVAGATLVGEDARRDARHALAMAESGATPDQASWFFLFVPDEARELLRSYDPGRHDLDRRDPGNPSLTLGLLHPGLSKAADLSEDTGRCSSPSVSEGSATRSAQAMEDLADYYEKRLEKPNWGVLRLIEPIPLFLAVVILGFMVWAFFAPFFNFARTIK